MADRTAELREAMRLCALRLGRDAKHVSSLLASPSPLAPPRSDFSRSSAAVGAALASLRHPLAALRRCESAADAAALAAELAAALGDVRARVDDLAAAAAAAAPRGDASAHRVGVALCLAERLASLARAFDAARAERAAAERRAIAARRGGLGADGAALRRELDLGILPRLPTLTQQQQQQQHGVSAQAQGARPPQARPPPRGLVGRVGGLVAAAGGMHQPQPQSPPPQQQQQQQQVFEEPPPPPPSEQQRQMDAEGAALAEEMSRVVDEARAPRPLASRSHRFVFVDLSLTRCQARAAERAMLDVSALSATFAAAIASQADQIAALCVTSHTRAFTEANRRYATACDTTLNFERGNKELATTLRRSKGARKTVAVFLLLASFMLLFLDWLVG